MTAKSDSLRRLPSLASPPFCCGDSIQRPDGSWYGNWGVCFTYGTWFGCEALAAAGETHATSPSARAAAAFLLQKQRADGGWGESYLSCQDKVGREGSCGRGAAAKGQRACQSLS